MVIDDSFDIKYHHNRQAADSDMHYLSVMICPNSFMYAVLTADLKNLTELCHVDMKDHTSAAFRLHEKIALLVQNYSLHSRKFGKINISVLDHNFTIVPPAFAENTDLKKLLQFSSGNRDIRNGVHKHIKNLDFYYALNYDLVNFLEKTFPTAAIYHNGVVTISSFFDQHSLKHNDLFLSIYSSNVELAVKQNGELVFYNVFDYQNSEDVLYYLLFTMEQFQLNPIYVKLVLAAQSGVKEDVIKSIKKYVRHVSLSVNSISNKLEGGFESLPGHYYFTLLNLPLCEL